VIFNQYQNLTTDRNLNHSLHSVSAAWAVVAVNRGFYAEPKVPSPTVVPMVLNFHLTTVLLTGGNHDDCTGVCF